MANRATITYNGRTISTEDRDGDFAVTYNNNTIATIGAGTTKTLNCSDKLMRTNVIIGGKTLNCTKKKMASNITISVISLFPSEPSSYNLIGTYTSSQTWTAPENGYFQIEAFGASGNGGKGGHFYQKLFGSFSIAGSGGGGGGGGYACSRVKMNKGDTVVLTAGAVGSDTSATINSSVETYSALNVTSGGNGTDTGISGMTATGGTGGAGGTGSGGNYSNKTGGKGGDGKANSNATSAPAAGTAGTSAQSGGNSGGKGGTGYSTKTGLTYYGGTTGSSGFFKIYRGNTNL